MDKLSFDAEITDVKWVTNTKGLVQPILVLDKEYEAIKDKDSQKFDGIMFTDIEDVKAKMCGIGSKVEVVCNEQLVPTIGKVYETADAFKFPKTCMYCKHELNSLNGQYVCINHLCIAQGRTPLFKLIILSNMIQLDRKAVIDVHKYLNKFPHNGTDTNIEHIYSYLKLLQQILPEINTPKRKNVLTDTLGEKDGAGVWLYEFTVAKKLRQGLEPHEFLYVLGLPLQEKDREKLSKYDFIKNGIDAKKIKRLKLSEHGQQVVFDNNQLIKLVYTELRNFLN